MEAISHAGTVLGILAKDGVVLAAEKKVTSKLLEQDKSSEKVFQLSGNVIAGVAGLTADANSLVNYARNAAQKYLLSYDDEIPVEQLVQRLCDMKQGYTQFGGLRPFGVSFLYAGYDPHHEFQLYQSDPSGNYSGWKAMCIGMNNGTATSLLKQEYKEDFSVQDALGLAARVLSKTMDTTAMESDKLEFAVLVRNPRTGEPQPHILSPEEIDSVLKRQKLAKVDENATGDTMAVDA
ncbi:proteasome endopeptidase complex [Malassezia japonica]|uniref:Proteasome subunit beta n=1 Tax=Malassezia japonica TaxID=223818 RepID=A0AAF0F699_9BASI|nr:proteasome endopeptidase complex [Malassezia japonica]WFD39173.1 proteasome endopeptidase complex [Malassezia japonica]